MNSEITQPDSTGFARPPAPPTRKRVRFAIAVMALGAILAVVGVGYLIYAEIARSRLDNLVYEVSQDERTAWLTAPVPDNDSADGAPADQTPVDGDPPVDTPGVTGLVSATQLFPARWTNPRYWAEPEWAGALPYGGAGLPDDFEYVNAAEILSGPENPSPAATLEIPAIGLSTTVYDLQLFDEGDQVFWESPVDIVGHIPGTSLPGQTGAGWYFGHLESPVRGEGNVFHDLPEVVDLIKHDPVDVIIGSDDGEFLYRVTGTGFIHRDDLVLDKTSGSTVTLVASYPKLVYDHRLLVMAELLAYRAPG